MEIRLLSDQQYGEEFDLVVDEIIDRYVAGEFTGDELDRVRNYFFKSKHRQDKLRFARTLKERESNQNPQIPDPEPVNHWTWLPRLSFAPSLALAATLIAVAGIGLLGYRAYFSRPDPREGLVALQLAFPERPVEGRLSDFNHVPLPNQRGGPPKIDYVQRDLAATLLLKTVRDNPTAASHHAVAKYYLMIHQFDQAEKEFAAALALEPKNAKIHNDFGSMFLEQGRLQNLGSDNGKQFELYARGLEEIQTALNLDSSLLEAQFNRALLFQLMKPSDQAKAAWNEYLQHDNSSPWAEEARRNLKLLEQEQRSTTSDNVKTFLLARHDSDDRAAWKTIGETYTAAGNEITNHLVDSVLKAGSGNNAADALDALTYLAELEENQSGDRFTQDLVNYYRRAPPGARPILANARRHMEAGFSLFDEAKFRAAIREYTIAKSHFDQTDDRASKALVEYRLAHCYVLLPDPERARSAFNRLLILCEQNKYRWLAAQCLFGLAHASADLNEYTKAIDYSSHALANFEEIGDVNGTLKCLSQLADFNQVLSRISTALGYLSYGWALATSRQSHPKERWSLLIQLGFSMGSLQLRTAALFYQKEALSLALETGTPLRISRSYAYVGSAYAAMKKYAEATNEATHAFDIGRSMGNDPSGIEIMANASQQLGDIQREAGRCDLATEHYDTSLRLYKDLKFDYYEYVAHKGKLYCFMATSNNQGVRDELASVLGLSESYRSKITVESQRDSFFDAEQEVYDVAIAFAESVENDKVKAFEYSEQSRARSLLDAVKRGAELQRKHGESDLHLPSVSRSLSFIQLQKKIPPNVQIVQYAVLDDSLVIWVITKSTIDSAIKPLAAADLTKKVSAFLAAVTQQPTNSDNFHRELSTDLYNALIAPIERQLDKSKVLVIVPDKILNFVPYAALTSPDNARYLIEDYDIAVAPSSSLFVSLSAAAERKPRAVEERILSVGNPRFNRDGFKSLRDLPSSAQEARSVADFYPTQGKMVLLRDDAKESKIVSELKKVDVAHFAMHFVTDDQSEMLSGFPLTPESSTSSSASDGILQSFEIYGLNLRRLRLVVLSACQTGIEKQYRGEGAVGAARPFIVAGVPTVVASLWSVDSDASAQLMIDLHRNLRRSVPVVKALKQSQMELVNGQNPLYRHPYYWAPFLTIGGLSSD